MKRYCYIFLLTFTIIASSACSNEGLTGLPVEIDKRDILVNNNWVITQIIKKEGTDDPYAVVSPSQTEIINSGSQIAGEIDFLDDNRCVVLEAEDNYLLSNYAGVTWTLEDDFIYFRRTDVFGNFTNAWGYNILSLSGIGMTLYSSGMAIHSGTKHVTVIELMAVQP